MRNVEVNDGLTENGGPENGGPNLAENGGPENAGPTQLYLHTLYYKTVTAKNS